MGKALGFGGQRRQDAGQGSRGNVINNARPITIAHSVNHGPSRTRHADKQSPTQTMASRIARIVSR